MKKNQSGVSMVSLVITIIVIIILAAVAFSGSQETIGRAGFSGFATDIDSVRTAFITEGVTSLMGEQTAANNSVSEPQAFNYLAKGATTTIYKADKAKSWLPKGTASTIQCTRIEPDSAKEAIGIELPERTVNTWSATKVPMSYFVTNKGDIFVWPPYERSDEGLFYVNDTIAVSGETTNGLVSGDDEEKMYVDGFTFDVNGVTIKLSKSASSAGVAAPTADTASVYYEDKAGATAALGIESTNVTLNDATTAARK